MPDTEAERRAKRGWEQRERAKDPEGFKQRQREAQKRYYEKNAEKLRERRRKYHADNLEKERERGRADYEKNKEKRKAASSKWKKDNQHKVAEYRKDGNLKRYGITHAQKQSMFTSQGNCCACCKSTVPRTKNGWHVDHCHITGKVRGVLCHSCNVALGAVQDNTEQLRSLIVYLEVNSAQH
jgi:hypothetical protein